MVDRSMMIGGCAARVLGGLVLALACSATPSTALASTSYVLTVVDATENGTPEGMDVIARVTRALQQHHDVEYRELHRLLDAGANEMHYGNVASAQQSFQEGRAAFDRGEPGIAVQNLENALFFLNSSFGFQMTPTTQIDVMLYLGAAQLRAATEGVAAGEEVPSRDDALRTLRALLVMHPDLLYPTNRFDDAFNDLVEVARAEVRRLPEGDLRLDTESGLPAQAFVDGKYRGITPLTVFGLREGSHQVRFLRQGAAVSQAQVQVDGGRISEAFLEMEDARKAVILENLLPGLRQDLDDPDGVLDAIPQLKGLLFTEYAVVVRAVPAPYGSEVQAGLFNLISGSLIRTARVVFGQGEPEKPAQRIVERLLQTEPVDVPLAGTARAPGSGGEGGVLTRWWFWTAVGAVVAGGVVTAVLLTQDSDTRAEGLPRNGTGVVLLNF